MLWKNPFNCKTKNFGRLEVIFYNVQQVLFNFNKVSMTEYIFIYSHNIHIIVLHRIIIHIFTLDIAYATFHLETCNIILSLDFIGPVVF